MASQPDPGIISHYSAAAGGALPEGFDDLQVTDAVLWDRLFPAHLAVLDSQLMALAEAQGFAQIVIPAGSAHYFQFDDQPAPYRPNPHFARWVPTAEVEGSLLLFNPGGRHRLLFPKPEDYWHLPPTLPAAIAAQFEVDSYGDQQALAQALRQRAVSAGRIAVLGDPGALPLPDRAERNPPELLAALHFQRAEKTRFELVCMQRSSQRAALGHRAARSAFANGIDGAPAAEFDIHQAYLNGSRQTANELPYSSIVALNTHCGVLHYQHYGRRAPEPSLSLLIDAGANYAGYASDVTRTYAAQGGVFADLVEALDQEQQALINGIAPGQSYLHLHVEMHQRVTRLLCALGLFRCGEAEANAAGLSESFFPHGLGHFLGLQTHDVGGMLADPSGRLRPPPERYGALRLTRPLAPGQVFTIEPGIYFIPLLLAPLLAGPHAALVDRALLDSLMPFGGIRIEDNVLLTDTGALNLTRQAFREPVNAL